MSRKITKMNESQLCGLIADITKQYLKESMGLDPEFEDGLDDETPPESLEDEYDDWFPENPAETDFADENEPDGEIMDDTMEDYDTLLENKEKEDLAEKQTKLLSFITENWDNHANNLIK